MLTSPSTRRHRPRHRLQLVAAALVATVTAVLPAAGAAAQEAPVDTSTTSTTVDPIIQARQAALTDRAQVLRAEAGVVRGEVLRLNAAVATQQQKVADAQAAADAATAALEAARDARTDADERYAEQRARTKRLAANAYIQGPASVNMILRSETINDAVRRQSMANAAGDATTRTLRNLEKAKLAAKRAELGATAAAQDAAAKAADAQTQASTLAEQQAQQTLVLSAVSERLEHTLSEAAALADTDSNAADAVAARDAALQGLPLPAGPSGVSGLRPNLSAVPTTVVAGIRVATIIAPQVQGLLDAARAAGFNFGGGGYRDSASQIALRVLHCGTTDFDIYEKPAGECVPPTARPGTSNHERGMAIDFTVDGRALVSESDPAFLWLAENASAYGLFNLPGEPWHWSTTGT